MTTTTTDAVINAIGAALVAYAGISENSIYYQQDPITSPYDTETIFVNQGDITKKRLLQDLYELNHNIEVVAWTANDAREVSEVPQTLRTLLNTLLGKVNLALNTSPSFGGLVRFSETYSVLTDGGFYAEAGKAVAKVYLRTLYYTVN